MQGLALGWLGTEMQGSALGRLRRALGVAGARLGTVVTAARVYDAER